MSKILFTALLFAVGIIRFFELGISKRHQQKLIQSGASLIPEPTFRWIVILHTILPIAACLEVWTLNRPIIPKLSAIAGTTFLLGNMARWWVIRTMGNHWNVQIMNSTQIGVVTSGPFQYVRHPNYVAVFIEIISLPLIHTAWLTALLGAIANTWLLHKRITLEESILFSNQLYKQTMAHKPRFLPHITLKRRN